MLGDAVLVLLRMIFGSFANLGRHAGAIYWIVICLAIALVVLALVYLPLGAI